MMLACMVKGQGFNDFRWPYPDKSWEVNGAYLRAIRSTWDALVSFSDDKGVRMSVAKWRQKQWELFNESIEENRRADVLQKAWDDLMSRSGKWSQDDIALYDRIAPIFVKD